MRTILTSVCLVALSSISTPLFAQATTEKMDVYGEFNYGQDRGGENWIQSVMVSEPPYRSEVKGDVTVKFKAPGMTLAKALCWQQPTDKDPGPWGHDENVTPDGIMLDAGGNGSFVFPGEKFPNGPINVRIFASNPQGKQDICELQLFNTGGVKWNQGLPKETPAAAKGLDLVFADDFETPPSISNDGTGATYSAHKPRGGDFSGWQFSNVLGDGKPFSQKGTWLKIAARKDAESPKGRSGLIASISNEGKGIWAKAPAYFECRFTAQSAIGTWPAFWTMAPDATGTLTDELDIIEAYGGMGKGNPNHPGYSMVGHFWNQKNPDGTKMKHPGGVAKIMELGGKSYWSTTFHTYGCYIGLEDTVYYFDDIEVFRHPTGEVSKKFPHFFLINYAIGGISGWKIDLKRYNEGTDMYVDYVRVFGGKVAADYKMPYPGSVAALKTKAIGLNFSIAGDASTELKTEEVAGSADVSQTNWNNLPGASGTMESPKDHAGKAVKLAASWEMTSAGQASPGRDWGFTDGNGKLQKGLIRESGRLLVTGVPYEKYAVYVYFGAGDHGGKGSVTISSPSGGVDPNGTYFTKVGWSSGKFVKSAATTKEAAKDSNCAVFSGNTAKDFSLDWSGKIEGQWTGVTGLQIVETP